MKTNEDKSLKALSLDQLEMINGGGVPDMSGAKELIEIIIHWFD